MEEKYRSYLKRVSEEVVNGILEGIADGVGHGVQNGAREGLKDSFTGGVIDIKQDDIRDVLEDTREGFIKDKVKEYAKVAFEKHIDGYVREVCGALIESVKREDVSLDEEQEAQVLDILIKNEREEMRQIAGKLPDNPWLREIVDGIQIAVEENLSQSFRLCVRTAGKEKNVLEGTIRGLTAEDKPKKDVRSPVSYLVKETVGDVVYKVIVTSTKRIVKELKDARKDEFIYKLVGSHREALEPGLRRQLDERTKQMNREVLQNSTDRAGFIRGLERNFEQGFREYLLQKPVKRSRVKPVLIAIVCIVVVVAAGIISRPYWSGDSTPAPDASSQPRSVTVPENIRNAVITLERTPCFGACPVYTLTIYGTGRVVYEGIDYVNVTGTREGSISDEQVMSLISRFTEIDYFSLNDSYEQFNKSDMPSAITSITMNELTKTVRHYHGDTSAPEVLTELEDFIDETVNSAQWVGANP
jgi:hypothetical protein